MRAAMLGNAGIAIAKFVAWGFSGSVALLAEGVHSIADTANQALLLVGLALAAKVEPRLFPFGRARESYFWSFVVALVLFFVGGGYAVYEGIEKLLHPSVEHHSPLAAVLVLGVSAALEAWSFSVALGEFNKGRGRRSFRAALLQGKDPTIPVVLLEDFGALTGLLLALVAVAFSAWTGSSLPDAVGSVLIGLLLMGIGTLLMFETHSLLIGEGATPEMQRAVLDVTRETAGVEDVRQLITQHVGPSALMVAMKVRFREDMTLAELERTTDAIEERVRAAVPEAARIFVEADGDYDAALDPAAPHPPVT